MDDFMIGGFRDEEAWHKKGITKAGGWPDAQTSIFESGIDKAVVHAQPIQYTNPLTGELVTSDKKFILVREPIPGVDDQWREYKAVTNKYKLVTPMTIAQMLDAEPNPLTKSMPVDTVFLLGKGDRFGISLIMEDSIPLGDENERHLHRLFIADTFRGGGSVSVMETEIRPVCWNTWLRAFETGTRKMTFPHIGDPALMLEFRINLEKVALQMRKEAVEQLEAMMKFEMDKEQRRQVLLKVFPDPKPEQILNMANSVEANELPQDLLDRASDTIKDAKYVLEKSINRIEKHRLNVMTLFNKFNDEHPAYANTAYALGNAFTEYADWRKGRGTANRVNQILFGGRAREKRVSYAAITDIMNNVELEPEAEMVLN